MMLDASMGERSRVLLLLDASIICNLNLSYLRFQRCNDCTPANPNDTVVKYMVFYILLASNILTVLIIIYFTITTIQELMTPKFEFNLNRAIKI